MELQELPARLLPWYQENKRDLPWRRDREPYHVFLSEIMLQQTRVEAVKSYYLRFLEALPNIEALAACDEDRLHKLWEGLGYYTRVRNLQKAAKEMETRLGGRFPEAYEEVRSLPGVGDYTAGAICSICYGQPTPAVDGNVLRVISRLRASYDSISKPQTKREITELLREIYPEGACGAFTQALMELGATVCLPNGAPDCGHCPAAALCRSREEELYRVIPVKDQKKPRRKEQKTVFLLQCGEKLAVRKRADTGLLGGLWEFPNVSGLLTAREAVALSEQWGCHPRELQKSVGKTHIFTHIVWEMTGYYLLCDAEAPCFVWADREALDRDISLPTAFRQFREAE